MNNLIQQEQHAGLLTLTLNRPDKLNALSNAMYDRLADLFFAAAEDDSVQAILLTGGEQCFTAGNDLQDFLDSPPKDMDSPAFRLMRAVVALDKPLIAAVCGAAIGIGTTVLLHCDQVLVTRTAKLRMPFVNLGLCPEFGASLLLPQLLGQARAARLLLWGDGLSGAQAVEWGLANQAFETGAECLQAAREAAQRVMALPQASVRISKRLMKAPQQAVLEETLRRENQLFVERLNTPEAKGILKGLLAKS
ncbi:enoyl-CoA hydratase-related protein [Pseudomonas sp. R5(2019)]|uniref:enoyl-CoA hydratase-related protein n=1 Tax=Pseudomonas sp. R5(2019) TaxID=2697566 RepID=UPI0014134389|nr:enoyl-CoA hydratase-related protein [Pseudomonas sp. R5(2019)]NBA98593.1 enoyl-CoA hydratase [Pseudomonas sp. R5(2019)]